MRGAVVTWRGRRREARGGSGKGRPLPQRNGRNGGVRLGRETATTAAKTLFLAFISHFIQRGESRPSPSRRCPAFTGLRWRWGLAFAWCPSLFPPSRAAAGGRAGGPACGDQRLSPVRDGRSTTRSRCRRCGGSARCPSGPRRCSATASAGCGAGGGPGCACTAWLPSPLGRREGSRRRRQKTRGEGNHTALLRWEHGPCVYTQDEKHLSGVL